MMLAMAYAALLSAAVAAVAALGEVLLRSRGRPGRWTGVAALAVVGPITAFVMLAPRPEVTAAGSAPAGAVAPAAAPVAPASVAGVVPFVVTDSVLAAGWLIASLFLLGALAGGQWRLARARRRARPGEVQGHRVLLTEDLGPAVGGLARPVVFLPRWVAALDDASQRLLLEHEAEHVRRRDTALLMGGALVTALLPWNPVAWWLTRRLRLAIELDCDRRVLATNPGVRRYADLLLIAAARPRFATRLLAAHFGEHPSDLERRIDAMTATGLQWRPFLATAAAAAILLVVACEAPRPDPVAPWPDEGAAGPTAIVGAAGKGQPDKAVVIARGSTMPRYPEILREAGVEGEVLARFIVGEDGTVDPASLTVLRSTHELFSAAVRSALPSMRFTPAESDGRAVRQQVEQPFTFSIVGNTPVARSRQRDSVGLPVRVTGVPGTASAERRATVVLRHRGEAAEEPGIVVRAADGTTLRRYDPAAGAARIDASGVAWAKVGKSPLGDITPADIGSVEVIKGRSCPSAYGLPCPLIVITLKQGRDGPYRPR